MEGVLRGGKRKENGEGQAVKKGWAAGNGETERKERCSRLLVARQFGPCGRNIPCVPEAAPNMLSTSPRFQHENVTKQAWLHNFCETI